MDTCKDCKKGDHDSCQRMGCPCKNRGHIPPGSNHPYVKGARAAARIIKKLK